MYKHLFSYCSLQKGELRDLRWAARSGTWGLQPRKSFACFTPMGKYFLGLCLAWSALASVAGQEGIKKNRIAPRS